MFSIICRNGFIAVFLALKIKQKIKQAINQAICKLRISPSNVCIEGRDRGLTLLIPSDECVLVDLPDLTVAVYIMENDRRIVNRVTQPRLALNKLHALP